MKSTDFDLIAATLKPFVVAERASERLEAGIHIPVDVICLALSYALATTNPRFDRERFLTACGVPPVNH